MTVSVTADISQPYRQTITARNHTWYADTTTGGAQDTAPTPGEMLLGALGACTAMTIQDYAKQKGLNVTAIKVDVSDTLVPSATGTGKVPHINKDIEIKGSLTATEKADLEKKAGNCHVNRVITKGRGTTGNFNYVV